MTDQRHQYLAQQFVTARPRLVRVAYAILGSTSEAEDVVSDIWLRLAAADAAEPVHDVEAWGLVVVARAALDVYRSARRRRERYVGPWLPEPRLEVTSPGDPADRVTIDDSVSFALLVVLESLSPAERVAWVMHDLFGLTFTEVAQVVGRTPDGVRQLASRARRHLHDHAPRIPVESREHRAIVTSFLNAASGGDLRQLVSALDPAVVLTSDGGGEVTAARRPIHGSDKVARFVLGTTTRLAPGYELVMVNVNGSSGIALYQDNQLRAVISLTIFDGYITRVDIVRAPAKLGHHRPFPEQN